MSWLCSVKINNNNNNNNKGEGERKSKPIIVGLLLTLISNQILL